MIQSYHEQNECINGINSLRSLVVAGTRSGIARASTRLGQVSSWTKTAAVTELDNLRVSSRRRTPWGGKDVAAAAATQRRWRWWMSGRFACS
jgi:hypothetical protein